MGKVPSGLMNCYRALTEKGSQLPFCISFSDAWKVLLHMNIIHLPTCQKIRLWLHGFAIAHFPDFVRAACMLLLRLSWLQLYGYHKAYLCQASWILRCEFCNISEMRRSWWAIKYNLLPTEEISDAYLWRMGNSPFSFRPRLHDFV